MAEEFESQKQPNTLNLHLSRGEQGAEIYESLDWEEAKESVLSLPLLYTPSEEFTYYTCKDSIESLNLALEMRKFDQERFDDDKDFILITHEKIGVYLIKYLNKTMNDPETFPRDTLYNALELAAPIKEWHPKRFELEAKILGTEHLENIAELIEGNRYNPRVFVYYYQLGLTIDAQAIRNRVDIDKSYSDQIKRRAEEDIQKAMENEAEDFKKENAWFWATIDSHKWEELPKITVSQEQEEIMIQYLRKLASQRAWSTSTLKWKWVNVLKDKEINIED